MPLELRPDNPISRRAALKAAGCGVAIACGCARPAGSNGNADGWYALLSDPHIAADTSERLRGETMADNLRAVVSDILRATDVPRGVLVNGDIAFKHGQVADYQTFVNLVSPLGRNGVPLHLTLGNHDDRGNLKTVAFNRDDATDPVPDKLISTIDTPVARIVMLDSQTGVNVTPGRLGADQLAWLANDLDAHPATPAVILVHHNINANSESALRDTSALLDVLRPRRQAKAVVFGHTHVWNIQKIEDIHMINLPAIGYRFLAKQPLGWAVFRPDPAGAEIELRCVGGDRRKDGRRTYLKWRV